MSMLNIGPVQHHYISSRPHACPLAPHLVWFPDIYSCPKQASPAVDSPLVMVHPNSKFSRKLSLAKAHDVTTVRRTNGKVS